MNKIKIGDLVYSRYRPTRMGIVTEAMYSEDSFYDDLFYIVWQDEWPDNVENGNNLVKIDV